MLRSRVKPLLLIAAIALQTETPAYALQLVEARDGQTVEATVSLKEPTRIRLEKGQITDVFGNIYSSSCGSAGTTPVSAPGVPTGPQVNPLGEVVLECDRDKGEVYVRPVGTGMKPINLFVSGEGATYTLLLKRADVPADTIVIRDKSVARQNSGKPGATNFPAAMLGTSPVHIRSLKSMLITMASGRVSPDVRVEEVGRPIQLWSEARFTLMRTFESRSMIGEVYLLSNVSDRQMVVAEQEFDREDGNVLAVAIENHNLRPGEATNVYVIRSGGGN